MTREIFLVAIGPVALCYLWNCIEGSWFKKPYNNHIFHLSIIFVLLIVYPLSIISPTACEIWNSYRGDVGTVRRTLNKIEKDILCYDFKKIELSEHECYLEFIHKATGDTHSIFIIDELKEEYIHWYKNGELVIRNGVRNKQEFPAFHEDIGVCRVLNRYIFESVEDIAHAAERFKISQNLGNINLLNTKQTDAKTLEITAPKNTTITGTVSEQGHIIHTETL